MFIIDRRPEMRPREDVREDLGREPGADAGAAHGDRHLAHRRHQHREDRLMFLFYGNIISSQIKKPLSELL